MTALRPYPEYKTSGVEWLGAIPAQWSRRALRYLAVIETGTKDTVDADPEGAYPFIVRSPNPLRIGTYSYDTEAILTAGDGDVGEIFHHVHGRFDAHQRVYVLRAFRDVVPRFLYYYFSSEFINVVAYGGIQTTVSSLRRPMFTSFPIVLPSSDEQTRIAEFLDRETAEIDAFIADQEELIGLLAERRAATISHAVTKGLDPSVPMKDSGVEWLGEVPEQWLIGRIASTVAMAKNGLWGAEPSGTNDIRCVRVADFDRASQRIHDRDVTMREIAPSERVGRVLRRGDLLLEKSGGGEKSPVGFVVMYDRDEPAVTSNFVARVVLRPGMEPRFWTYVHGANYGRRLTARSIKQSTGIQNLDQSSYFNEMAAIPELPEQVAIADFLDRETALLDASIADAREAIALSRERRAALISAAVTGKIDVRGVV